MSRAIWILAAIITLSAIGHRPPNTARSGGIGAVSVGVAEGVIASLPVLAALAYVVRGILADCGDRLLMGALAGILSMPIVGLVGIIALPEPMVEAPALAWMYSLASALLLGAALARANGNLRRP